MLGLGLGYLCSLFSSVLTAVLLGGVWIGPGQDGAGGGVPAGPGDRGESGDRVQAQRDGPEVVHGDSSSCHPP